MNLDGARLVVMGLGTKGGGVAVVEYALAHGATVHAIDLQPHAATVERLEASARPGTFTHGTGRPHRDDDLDGADMVVRNPAVRVGAPILEAARDRHIPVVMELTIFADAWPGIIVGVTGTKGKTTTTNLVHQSLSAAGLDAHLAGNMGIPCLPLLDGAAGHATVAVLEISSFQTEGLLETGSAVDVMALTNLAPDHLDAYPDTRAYYASKLDYLESPLVGRRVMPVPAELPASAGYAGRSDDILVSLTRPAEHHPTNTVHGYDRRNEAVRLAGGSVQPLGFTPADVPIAGAYRQEQAVYATAAAEAVGADLAAVVQGLRTAADIGHRREVVYRDADITYINDTAATAPHAAAAAAAELAGTESGRLVILTGGANKNLAYDQLVSTLAANAIPAVLLPGPDSAEIGAAMRAAGIVTSGPHPTMEATVRAARALIGGRGTILLSPGFASFSEAFRDAFDRGDQFAEVARRIESDR